MRIRHLTILLAAVAMLASSGCKPQDAPATLCGDVAGAWFADATGQTALSDAVTGDARRLPLGGPDKRVRLSCNVFADDKVVAWFDAEVSSDPSEYEGLRRTLESSQGRWDFEVGGGRGRVDEKSKDSRTGIAARWTCGRTILSIGVKKFADKGRKMDLTKQLAERLAGATGCVG